MRGYWINENTYSNDINDLISLAKQKAIETGIGQELLDSPAGHLSDYAHLQGDICEITISPDGEVKMQNTYYP